MISDANDPPTGSGRPRGMPGITLNENHRRALAAAFTHIDGLLADAERAAASERSPFDRILPDLSPAERGIIADSLARIRGRMLDALDALGVPLPSPTIRAGSAIQTALTFAEIALKEIAPSRLQGYGHLDEDAVALVERVEADLERPLRRLRVYLARGLGKDPGGRLARLEQAPVDLQLLRELERIVTRRGLVEFRPALDALVDRLEWLTFEIALFGRVNSGKSSLLNAILDTDALPVGVTPVTAVPTRVAWGEPAGAEIRFAGAPERRIRIDQLREFVSEKGNPQNRKRVVRALVHLPALPLQGNVVLVDTPGVGSLMAAGAREAYAYLPRCDLGVLLVDAAGGLTPEDLHLLRLLQESGIPAMVVISKADLLSEPDRARVREYVGTELAHRLELDLPVHLVSSVGENAALAHEWFATEIAPLREQARELADASARRKLAALREGVAAFLRASLEAHAGEPAPDATRRRADVERLALEAEGCLTGTARRCQQIADGARTAGHDALSAAARELARQTLVEGDARLAVRAAVGRAITEAAESLRVRIRETLLGTRERLCALLDRMAEELGSSRTRPADLLVDLVTQPAPLVPREVEELELRCSGWLRPPSLRERRIAAQLSEQLEGLLASSFRSFGAELGTWSRSAVAALGERFAAQAEPYRLQARRGAEGETGGEVEEIVAELRALGERAEHAPVDALSS